MYVHRRREFQILHDETEQIKAKMPHRKTYWAFKYGITILGNFFSFFNWMHAFNSFKVNPGWTTWSPRPKILYPPSLVCLNMQAKEFKGFGLLNLKNSMGCEDQPARQLSLSRSLSRSLSLALSLSRSIYLSLSLSPSLSPTSPSLPSVPLFQVFFKS